ncbi:MAG: hypothetical protein IPK19_10075 [Chloroflexi bacterium]|nr:hypothetical protein [Chloroflexota bacterium]
MFDAARPAGRTAALPTIDPDRSLWARFVGRPLVGGNAGAAEIALADDTLSLVWQGRASQCRRWVPTSTWCRPTAMPVMHLLDGDGPAAYGECGRAAGTR